MFATLLHHGPKRSESAAAVLVSPLPKGVSVALYKCPLCGAVATTTRSYRG